MSTGPQPTVVRSQDQALLGELLHSLSQPLTSLRCSLELSVEEIAGQRQDAVSAALEQTDRAIAVVRLMREYLDTESAVPPQTPIPFGPVVRAVVDQLLPVAGDRQIRLHLTGRCSSTVALSEPRLRLALQYLIVILIEEQPRHREVILRLEQSASGSELRANIEPALTLAPARHDRVNATVHNVQLVIAARLLESAEATLVFDRQNYSGFLLQIPCPVRNFSPEPFS